MVVMSVGKRKLYSLCHNSFCISKYYFCSIHLPTQFSIGSIQQGTVISLELSTTTISKINIRSQWSDSLLVTSFGEKPVAVYKEYDEDVVKIISAEDCELEIALPEMSSIILNASILELNIVGKILGDLSITCNSGNLKLQKIKGENISIHSKEANLEISNLFEGRVVSIEANDLKFKTIHVDNLNLKSHHDIQIEALYSETSVIQCGKSISCGLTKGDICVEAVSGDVRLEGVDGSCSVVAHQGNITLQAQRLSSSEATRYSLDLEASGTILLTLDPEIEAQVSLQTSKNGLQASDSDQLAAIDIDVKGFHRIPSATPGVVLGRLSRDSMARNGPHFSKHARASGKISLPAAESQSSRKSENDGLLPKIDVCAGKSIVINTASWMDIISKKHGMPDFVAKQRRR